MGRRWRIGLAIAVVAAVVAAVGAAALLSARTLRPPVPDTVWLAELTWPEVREALRQGVDTVLVPVGGTEQGGRHLVLGKHNHTVAHAAERAARRLGKVLVAPVLPYAPEGAFAPPAGNMAFAGTLGLRDSTLAAWAEDIARSLKVHGVANIVFLADHGQSQAPLATTAARLDRAWRAGGTRVVHVAAYHGVTAREQREWLLANGFEPAAIGSHAGIADTSEAMFVFPAGVRRDRLGGTSPEPTGASGDASKADAKTGEAMLELKIKQVVAAVRRLRGG
jgi:creatinine amidohydrolase/Fe(II)-dependent formamide hydrolase-like protein